MVAAILALLKVLSKVPVQTVVLENAVIRIERHRALTESYTVICLPLSALVPASNAEPKVTVTVPDAADRPTVTPDVIGPGTIRPPA